RSKNTQPEMIVRRFLHAQGLRFRLHGKYRGKKLPGKPDLVFPKYRTVVFVNGCFWHGHQHCRYYRLPKTRRAYWKKKIEGNRHRDAQNYVRLVEEGWNVLLVWGCELAAAKREKTLNALALRILKI
ncbi:MAG: very short patch repair endonuclease, partial [Cytophagales bacterium]|nr:very short patch repair endonuclease [Cytophagales bacterium]